ncbi:MAG TPA: DUF2273 domain-containing protein [Spirochaetota bacterium]
MGLDRIIAFVSQNPGKAIGASVGLIIGILIFTIGFLKTFVVLLLTLTGYVIGRIIDDGRPLADQINDFLNRK